MNPLERLLDLLRAPAPPVAVAPGLRALGVEDATDLAIVEFFVLDDQPKKALRAFVAAWPWVPGLGKAALASEAEESARLERLRARGALERGSRGRWRLSEALLRLLPAYPRIRATPDDAGGAGARGALDLARAIEELDAPPAPAGEDDERLVEALARLAARLAPLAACDRAAVDAEVAAMSPPARRLALGLLEAANDRPEGAVALALAAALETAIAALAPLVAPPEGPRPDGALRLLVLRFADACADIDPDWLAAGAGAARNSFRREELLRRFARWAGLDILAAGAPETPLAQLAGLLRADHRREALFAEEAAHRARIEKESAARIAAEQKRRDEAAASYASGRRE